MSSATSKMMTTMFLKQQRHAARVASSATVVVAAAAVPKRWLCSGTINRTTALAVGATQGQSYGPQAQQQQQHRHHVRFYTTPSSSSMSLSSSSFLSSSSLYMQRQQVRLPQQSPWFMNGTLSFSSSSSGGPKLPDTSVLQIPRKGTGFDHFLRRGDGDGGKTGGADGKESGTGGGGGGGGGGGNDDNNNNNNNSGMWWTMAALMGAIAYAVSSSASSNDHQGNAAGNGGPREISWHDFLRLLQQRDIVKVLIEHPNSERPVAKVYLRPNAFGLARATSPSAMGMDGPMFHDGDETSSSATGAGAGTDHRGGEGLPSPPKYMIRRTTKGTLAYTRRGETGRSADSNNNNNNNAPSRSTASTAAGRMEAEDFLSHPPQDEVQGMGTTTLPIGGGGVTGVGGTTTTMAAGDTNGGTHVPSLLYYRLPIGNLESFERKLEEAQRVLGRSEAQDVPVQFAADATVGRELLATVPGLLLAALLYGMIRFASPGGAGGGFGAGGRGFGSGGSGSSGGGGGMGGIFQIGKSTHKKVNKQDIKITFADVAGCDEAKKEIMEFVDFLKDATRFTKLGAKIPKGALLCGPPGTGKTLLAKAVAGEAGVPFYSISGSDFIEMFVGVGPSRVRDLFSEARQNAPCIVFIDEIDAVGRQRGRGGVGGNDERENTLNQLLVEMDGFEPSTGVVVLAGTNRVDILDQALTRPGRFDRQITVDKPDLNGRKQIFKVHLKGIKLEDEIDDVAGRLAGLTPGFAGADIANICNEAAIVAARRKAESVSLEDFEKATDRIIGGLESNKIMSKEERSIVAHHEAGHAIAGWFLEHADPLLKVTIIPRSSGALGFAQYLPKEVFLRTYDQIMDIVCMALAGRAAEEIFFGRVTTGASDDLKKVTEMVFSTIQIYGMNPKLGQLSFPKDPNAFFEERPYSEKTAKAMDEEARSIVDAAYERTLNLLREKKTEVEKLASMLLDKETITHDDIITAIGPRPFKGDPAYEEFIRRRQQDKKEHGEPVEPMEEIDNTTSDQEGDLKPGLA